MSITAFDHNSPIIILVLQLIAVLKLIPSVAHIYTGIGTGNCVNICGAPNVTPCISKIIVHHTIN
ncbi:hypothetical protein BDV37DRAFT_18235 [Aspergillus pseudonomiae]|uniref:Uncharacterized protein n=1 Tax=Aspergillus pseudonomiae TaxID=1506151 RepID=A0A5N7DN54_9EURO|nr:uncharacterized protein BDV37DRAFT_18235 [Aspergillus pseudonomiae]KAE8407443.1 hypothetical protein BDV37DRAFT_18235 [Aspergillus pseudonomiae]